jgi:hypothetical protein
MQVTVTEPKTDISLSEMKCASLAIVTEVPSGSSDWKVGDLVGKSKMESKVWNVRTGSYADDWSNNRVRPLKLGEEVTIKIDE